MPDRAIPTDIRDVAPILCMGIAVLADHLPSLANAMAMGLLCGMSVQAALADTAMEEPVPVSNSGPVIRRFQLPNGRFLVSLRADVFQRALAAANRALRGSSRPQLPEHFAPCSCGWHISPPRVKRDRKDSGDRAIGYKVWCVGCTKSTGFRPSLDEAVVAWERIANV